MSVDPLIELQRAENLASPSDALGSDGGVPRVAGCYGWYFREIPTIDTTACHRVDDLLLGYIGIAPCNATSRETLRSRIRTHARRNASASTLRRTIGCLLSIRLC